MKTNSKYVIGDIQGCYKEFKNLIKLIDPNKENKFLCVGDLVNRGPESEKVVDYVIKNNVKSVFGNHDLHLMAILIGARKHNKKKDTMQRLINKNKAIEIIDYFSQFSFAKVVSSNKKKSLIVHAGVLPSWSLDNILSANDELQEDLKKRSGRIFFDNVQRSKQSYIKIN